MIDAHRSAARPASNPSSNEARRLREEAQALLGEFERKAREAESEAQAIIAGAKAEAERLAAEAKSRAGRFCRPAHQDGRDQDRPGRSSSGGRCAFCRSRSRGGRRGENPRHSAKGKIAEDLLARGIAELKQKFNSEVA